MTHHPFSAAAVEAAARVLMPGRWTVMDTEKATCLRKYRQQFVGYPAEQFQDTKSMIAAEAALSAACEQARKEGNVRDAWLDEYLREFDRWNAMADPAVKITPAIIIKDASK